MCCAIPLYRTHVIFNWNRFYKLKMIHITSPLQKEKVIKKYLFGIVFAHL